METSFEFNSIQLNSDLHVAGEFLYEGCFELDALTRRSAQYESRLFSALYKIAVGIERLQKTILILQSNAQCEADLDNENSDILYKHSHTALGNKLECLYPEPAPTKRQRHFLQSLTDFYGHCRYNYYHFEGDSELAALHIAEFSGRKPEFKKANMIERHSMIAALVKPFEIATAETIQLYIDMLPKAKGTYFTDESESYSKFSIIKYLSGDVFAFFALRRLAVLELTAQIGNVESRESFFDGADTADFMRSITQNETCGALVDALTEFYREEKGLDLYENRSFVEDRIAELEYRLSPDLLWEEYA